MFYNGAFSHTVPTFKIFFPKDSDTKVLTDWSVRRFYDFVIVRRLLKSVLIGADVACISKKFLAIIVKHWKTLFMSIPLI